ncbi:MAG: long-chain fatty acid--CoA ligase [Desulfobacterales bacterium]|jgi:long-chain acyl-CoA synthetase|nr:long-chain fatty acid--CoA ligase [Desulfobacterales bacterium]
MRIVDYQNIHQMLKKTVDAHSNITAYRWFLGTDGTSESVTWAEFYDQVKQAGKSMMSLGVQKGDKVIILSYTCYKWTLIDMANTTIGAATVGIYQSNLPEDCKYIINHSDSVIVFAENKVQLDKILEIRNEIPNIRKVILFNGSHPGDEGIISFDEFMKLGKNVTEKDLQQRIKEVTPKDVATFVYTSGTTGVPKGAVITHDNVTFTAQSVENCVDVRDGDENFLFLPLAHIFARTCVYATMLVGATINYARSMDTIVDDLKQARPHWFPSVPRIYEKVYSKVVSGAEAKGGVALKIFKWAVAVGDQWADCQLNKQAPSLGLTIQHKIATKLVFSKLHAALGGRLRFCISGAAPLDPTIEKFFIGAGVIVLEGLGMTENTSFTNVNRLDNFRVGWVGPPGPGIEQKIDEDGEILFKGRNVMREYYKMPEETAKTFTADGWLRTGDLGEIDNQNFLRITGRKKDLIITAGGKNIAPSAIEGHIATSKYINQVVVIGDRQKFLTALITLDQDNIKAYAAEKGIAFTNFEELFANDEIVQLINSEVAEKNKKFGSWEQIKKITIVPEFTVENKMMTPTLKVKKNVAMDAFKEQINAMHPKE